MCRLVVFLLFLSSFIGISQKQLTAEERAYLFHIVKKSPILNTSIGRYFDYKGPEVRLPNKDLNYDSIELLIINKPELLIIRTNEIAKSSKGILGEAANKMAIWELNKTLVAKHSNDKSLEAFLYKYENFKKSLLEKLPTSALKQNGELIDIHPKVEQLSNPSLTLNEKIAQLETMRFLTPNEQLLVLNAISKTINDYVEQRSRSIFTLLGGEATTYRNVLVAAGDGSGTAGLLEEREKDEKGRWNRGLPKAVGLFPYQLVMKPLPNEKEPVIQPLKITETNWLTAGGNRSTAVHFDVWGYNSKKQTTVVIEKNGLSYHLFGSGETRFLTPDSSFVDGGTFQSVINELEFKIIGRLEEKIYGKRGLDYWIEFYSQERDETEMKIEKNEYGYSEMNRSSIITKKKAPRSVRKARKKASKTPGGGPVTYQPKTVSNRKQKRAAEQSIVELYGIYEGHKRKVAELQKEKQSLIDQIALMELKLNSYKQAMGYKWASYTVNDGLYTFEDSSTFDMYTQDFQFPPGLDTIPFEVRLIAIPDKPLSESADEVMMHMQLVDTKPNYTARVQLKLTDQFASDKWELNNSLLQENDSVAVLQFFEVLKDKKVPLILIPRGNGVGEWDGIRVMRSRNRMELPSYPNNSEDSLFKRLRFSEVNINLDRSIQLEINSYTDPVRSNLTFSNAEISELMKRYQLTSNDLLSALRTASIAEKLRSEFNVLAGRYLDRETAKIVIDRLNKEMGAAKISIGPTSIKLSELNMLK